jgi:hypothetical protein
MWTAVADGKPITPDGDLDPVPFKPLWSNVLINPLKTNHEKESIKISECLEK